MKSVDYICCTIKLRHTYNIGWSTNVIPLLLNLHTENSMELSTSLFKSIKYTSKGSLKGNWH